MKENSSTSSIRPDSKGRGSAFIDLAIIVAVLVGVKQAVLPYSLVFAGPASTFSAMAVGTFLLWRRGFGWSDLGLRWPKSWWVAIGISVAIFLAFLAAAGASSALADLWFEDVGTSGRFDFVNGNLAAYLLIMALVWTHGSFFEELLFRAFIITKLGDGLGGTPRGKPDRSCPRRDLLRISALLLSGHARRAGDGVYRIAVRADLSAAAQHIDPAADSGPRSGQFDRADKPLPQRACRIAVPLNCARIARSTSH